MKERILEILSEEERAYSIEELEDILAIRSADELKDLLAVLRDLENSLKIYHTNKGNYMLFNNSHLRVGQLIGNKKGFGFVDIEGDEDVFIPPTCMNGAIHGDQVIVEITSKKGLDLEGRIVKVLDRKLHQIVGEFYYKGGVGHIEPDDKKINIRIDIDQNKTMGAMNGHKVLVRLTGKKNQGNYQGEVIKVLGHKNDPGVDILSIVNKYEINDVFSDEVMEAVEKLPLEVTEEEYQGRRNLRDKVIFTIDGDDAKDLDDAVSIDLLENGHYLLGVHIADVSHYVKENGVIDQEAYERGTSVYLADRVIPMLPHKLSNGICSLNGGVDRLTMSCDMEIDEQGNVVDYDIYESVINSKKRMTYKAVNNILEKNIVEPGYEPFVDDLKKMETLAHILRKNKERRGYIDFDIDEAKIIVNEKGEAIDVKVRERGTGEKLIEDFMIAANETVATHIYYMELPFIYRIHGKPNEEKIESFMQFLKTLGITVPYNKNNITSKEMQKVLDHLKDNKLFHLLSSLLLRSMQKAVYDKNNIGHFGLASKCYTHFTSPIRRYPDQTVHRLLRSYLFDKKLDRETIQHWDLKLISIAEHSSEKERNAVSCEREVDDMKKAEYMMKHIGEEYEGMITSVLNFGMFVELDNLIEGLISNDDMRGDTYYYDETTFSYVGKNTKKRYRLGDRVKVTVLNANKENKTIDFILSEMKNMKEEKAS